MNNAKVYISSKYRTDEEYRRFIELLMEVSELQEWEIVDRKDSWEEYEVFEDKEYVIECRLSNKEISEVIENNFKLKVVGGNLCV